MEIDQDEERSVWNFGNYLRTALFLLFACAILSHDRTDLALLEGGIGGPAIYHNWIGFLGAHAARIMFYTFGLATYPVLLILFLLLLRRFIPGLPRRGSLWWALPVILLGASMLFAMWPQQFIAETDHLGIGRMEQSSLALPGGVVGASLAAPQTASMDAGLVRRYIGDVGTILVALAFLLPGVIFLFLRDWLPLLRIAFRADPKTQAAETEEPQVRQPAGHTGRIYTPENPEGEVWTPEKPAPEIRQYADAGTEEEEAEEPAPAEKQRSKFKDILGSVLGLRKAPANTNGAETEENDEGEIIAPPVRPPLAQTAPRSSSVIRDPDELVVAPPQKPGTAARPAPGAVIRDPDELVVTPRPRPAAAATAPASASTPQPVPQPAPAPVPQPQEAYDEPEDPVAAAYEAGKSEDDFELEEPPAPAPASAPQPAPRVIPVQTFAENKKKFDSAPPPPAPANEPPPPPPVYEEYHLPSPMLLERHGDNIAKEDQAYIREAGANLEKTLTDFGVGGYVSNITVGPRVTQFEIALNPGVRVEKVTSIQNNIAMAMEAQSIRIRAPIPGKDAVGIEVPNKASSTVYLRPLLESATWRESHAAIPILLGRDIAGEVYLTDLAKAPHLLIAGSTGSGKSVCMNTLIMSLLFRFSPDELKLIMVDPKVVELEMYRPIPHLITPVVNDPKKVPLALRWGVNEMERRYMVLAKVKAKNLAAFNSRPPDPQPVIDDYGELVPPKLPILIIIIDELADIMMTDAKSDVETSICRIAQKGRAAGVHLVIATQSPRKDVVTGLIKTNFPTKIAFRVSTGMDSRVILDAVGAEKLLGNGDMLFNPPGAANLERIQGAYVSDPEIAKVIDEVAAQRPQAFDDGIFAGGDEEDEDEPKGRHGKGKAARGGSASRGDGGGYDDEMDDYDEIDGMANADIIKAAADKYLEPTDPPIMVRALEIIINEQQVSTSYLQRRLGIGYNKAADIIDKLEQRHVISAPLPGGQKRSILITDGLETPND